MTHKQLTDEERYQIEALKREGFNQSEIARSLGRHPSTINRELARNSDHKGYRGKLAIRRTAKRRQEAKKSIKLDSVMCSMINNLLSDYLSPEQISGRLKLELVVEISHESIYRYVWDDKRRGGDLYNLLRHKGKRYRKRGSAKDSRGQIIDVISIDERPEVVEQKSRIGDWEIDTVIGKNHQQAIVTIVERVSKFSVMKKVEKKTADAVAQATIDLLRPYKDRVLTITADRGKEFAYHQKVAKALECDYYFAHPYSSWERGLNENTNGCVPRRRTEGRSPSCSYAA